MQIQIGVQVFLQQKDEISLNKEMVVVLWFETTHYHKLIMEKYDDSLKGWETNNLKKKAKGSAVGTTFTSPYQNLKAKKIQSR